MAANTTSGNLQSYDLGHGTRIFQGLDPDIVLIQEFNYGNNSTSDLRSFVDEAFGEEFSYYIEGGNEQIPNGVISRFPIIESGEWIDSEVSNRDFAWARIDIPGDRHLWAVSVHFLTRNASVRNAQATALRNFVGQNVPAEDYLVIGGDFNTGSFNESGLNTLSSIVETDGRPDDQNGSTGTNSSRSKPYDQVLPDAELEALEIPVTILGHSTSYPEGLVFDSRVFTPLSAVSPVLSGDSGASGMQHMAVIRDFLVPTGDDLNEPSSYPTGLDAVATENSITLNWNDVTDSPMPDGYLIVAGLSSQLTSPVDGVLPTSDSDLSDGAAMLAVSQGTETVLFSGLTPETEYFFSVFPYVGSTIPNYKTDGTVPITSVETLASNVDLPDAPVLGSVLYEHSAGFTLSWERIEGATSYRLDVTEGSGFSGGGTGLLLSEDFDDDTDVPAGWDNDGSGFSSTSSHYSSAPYARAMGSGDNLISPSVDQPSQLSFYVDSSNGGEGQTGSVSYSIGGGAWVNLHDFVVSRDGEVETVDLSGGTNLSVVAGVRFRFESDFFTWYLDDVSVIGGASASFVDGFDGLDVGDVDYFAVDGLLPSTEYTVRLRAVGEFGESLNSASRTITTRSSGTPFSAWASDAGIGVATLSTDFDGDEQLDFEEFVFGTDPADSEDFGDIVSVESSMLGLRVSHRMSKAPGLSWTYRGSDTLGGSQPILSAGNGPNEYQILSVTDHVSYEVVTVEVNTDGADRFFFLLDIDEQ